MKRVGLIPLALMSALFISGCVQIQTDAGPATSQVRDISSFTGIEYKIPGTLHIDQGSNQTLRVDAGEKVISSIRTEVVNGVLTIDSTSLLLTLQPINVYLSTNNVSSINAITSSSAGSVACNIPLTANTLKLALTGAGSVTAPVNVTQLDLLLSGTGSMQLRGNATNMNIDLSGTGSINAYQLQTNVTSITLSGTGSAQVTVQDKLTANLSGTGSINYHGSPQVTQSRTGTGSINKTG
jgi:Putative auto-transporter adhesin, head GIN domain